MPQDERVPHIIPADMETEPLRTYQDRLDTQYALALVNETFHKYETYRSNNHDRRWNVHDQLYVGWTPAKVWEGTNIPRSSVGIQIVFDQVETVAPLISQAIFNVGPEWFQVSAEPGTNPEEAKAVQDTMSYYLEHPLDDYCVSAQTEIRNAIKSTVLYGNGGVGIEYDVAHKRPKIEHVDLRDFYFDDSSASPAVDDCRSIVRRKFLTVDELLDMAGDERMHIPTANQLYTMAKSGATAVADNTKSIQEAARGVNYTPSFSNQSPLPADRKVEVLIYYSKSRIIWVLNREWIAYNQLNPYGFIPFAFSPCYIYPGRAYAQSIADVQEENQKILQSLVNNHFDEVSLALHPPRIMSRSSNLSPSQLKWRPGAVYAVDNPKENQIYSSPNVTANVYTDVAYVEGNAEKRTGINGLSGGVPRASNANRTAGGMQMQMQGSGNRLSDLVANIENYLILPMLYKLYKVMQFHAQPGDKLQAYSVDKGIYEVDASVAYKKVKFRMSASSRMVTKDRLLQIFPTLAQFMFQGPFMEQLHQTGKTVDFGEAFRMLQEATNVGNLYNLIRPLTDQEKQALSQPSPELQAQMQKAQGEQQTRLQIMDKKIQGDMQVETLKKQPDAASQLAQQIEMQKAQQEMAMSQQETAAKIHSDQMMAQIKIAAEREKHKMDLQAKQADLQVRAVGHSQSMEQGQMSHQMKMQQMMDQLQMKKYAQDQGLDGATNNASPGGGQSSSGERPRKKAEVHHKTAPKK